MIVTTSAINNVKLYNTLKKLYYKQCLNIHYTFNYMYMHM